MIQDVDAAIAAVIVDLVQIRPAPEVLFDAPTQDWAGRRGKASTINCFLYDIREDVARSRLDRAERFDGYGPDRVRTGFHPRIRHMRLSYLVTAWASEPSDEHDVLGQLLMAFFETPVLPESILDERVRSVGLRSTLIAAQMAGDRRTADLWSAIGGNLKPAIDLQITLPVAPRFVADETKVVGQVPHIELAEVAGSASDRRIFKTSIAGGMAASLDDSGNVVVARPDRTPKSAGSGKH